MTKTEARRRRYNCRVAAKRFRRWKRRRIIWEARRSQGQRRENCFRDPETGDLPVSLHAPEVFTLSQPKARGQTLRFLEEMRRTVEDERRRVHINFSKTQKMVADGTLLFYAVIYRLTHLTGRKKYTAKRKQWIKCSTPKDQIVEQVLQQVGIFGALGKNGTVSVGHDSVRHWHSATGTSVDGTQIKPVRDFYEGSMASPLNASNLYVGLTEAMTNCDHAYPADSPLGAEGERRWWMFSQEMDGMLSVAFCDLGIGIPASLNRGQEWNPSIINGILVSLGRLKSDAAMIEAAVELGTSATNNTNRGKGLAEIKQGVAQAKQGHLVIMSGYGYYGYTCGDLAPKTDNHTDRLPGTLILWKLPVQNEAIDGC